LDGSVAPEKVFAVHRALADAGLPHAIGGAIALSIYSAPRPTVDIDVNVFVAPERRPEVRAALDRLRRDGHLIHVFYSHDALHEEMARSIREVLYAGATIPIVAPEHLVIRKALLDRPKDWVDIEAILIACEPLDLEAIEAWLDRLADPAIRRRFWRVRGLLRSRGWRAR
jgi:SAM-dependent methyltransferase